MNNRGGTSHAADFLEALQPMSGLRLRSQAENVSMLDAAYRVKLALNNRAERPE